MERHRTCQDLRPHHLVEGVVAADVFPDDDEFSARGEQGSGMQAAGLVERTLRGPQQVRQREHDRSRDDRTRRQRIGPEDDLVDGRLATDPA